MLAFACCVTFDFSLRRAHSDIRQHCHQRNASISQRFSAEQCCFGRQSFKMTDLRCLQAFFQSHQNFQSNILSDSSPVPLDNAQQTVKRSVIDSSKDFFLEFFAGVLFRFAFLVHIVWFICSLANIQWPWLSYRNILRR